MRIKSFYDYTILYFQSCLSSSPSKPCFILHFKGVTLMLDCGLDIKEVLKFLPLPVVQRLVMLVHVFKCIIFHCVMVTVRRAAPTLPQVADKGCHRDGHCQLSGN